jgi:branched-chain amino acid aminotransferase
MKEIKDTYCNFNGHLVSIYEPLISFSNRAFRYGDALFETIRVIKGGKIMFLADHMLRIKIGMKTLRMNVPNAFTTENMNRIIQDLIIKNELSNDVRVRLTIFRNEGGFYTPQTSDISFLIEAEDLGEQNGYNLNDVGYNLEVFHEIKKHKNKLSNLKSANALLYVLAGIYKKDIKVDDCIILNEENNLCESISSNIFIVKNGALYTPAVAEGCVDGIMRKQVIQLAQQNRILCYEISLALNTLMNADEVFLTNAVRGIRWVSQYKMKNYQNRLAGFFTDKLNELIY